MDLKSHFPLTVDEEFQGRRFDQILVEKFPDVSRSRWGQLIDSGLFRLGGRPVKASYKAKAGDTFELDAATATQLQQDESAESPAYTGPEPEIIFEDKHLVVINKPLGLAVHPGSGLPLHETLAGWLQTTGRVKAGSSMVQFDEDVIEDQRPGIVHRLDKGTSGLLVMAKDPNTHTHLAEQFQSRQASRIYWAVVAGNPLQLKEKRSVRVNSLLEKAPSPIALRFREDGLLSFGGYLERDPRERTKFRISPLMQGKKSLTHFQVLDQRSDYAAVALKLSTGRTHQIRVHMNFLGSPILGDTTYGGNEWPRMMLHAQRIRFEHPVTGTLSEFHCDWNEEDRKLLQKLQLDFSKEPLPWPESNSP